MWAIWLPIKHYWVSILLLVCCCCCRLLRSVALSSMISPHCRDIASPCQTCQDSQRRFVCFVGVRRIRLGSLEEHRGVCCFACRVVYLLLDLVGRSHAPSWSSACCIVDQSHDWTPHAFQMLRSLTMRYALQDGHCCSSGSSWTAHAAGQAPQSQVAHHRRRSSNLAPACGTAAPVVTGSAASAAVATRAAGGSGPIDGGAPLAL